MIKDTFGGIGFVQDKNKIISLKKNENIPKLKIAVIIDTALSIPPTTGVTYRLVNLTMAMQERGHEVIWVLGNRNFLHENQLEELKNAGCVVHLLNSEKFYDVDYISNLLIEEKIDVAQYEITQTFLEIGILVREKTNIPVLLEFHDIEATIRETLGDEKNVPLMNFLQYSAGIEADSVVVMTPLDHETLTDSIGVPSRKVFLAPNGIDEKYFDLRDVQKVDKNKLLFLGNLFYKPNQNAFVHFAEKILPIIVSENKEVSLRVIGMLPESIKSKYQNNPNIEFMGEVKDEKIFKTLIQECCLGICTVQSGSGMKVKILNYGAAGLPVITTKVGESGYENIVSLIRAESDEDIVIECKKVIDNPAESVVLGEKLRAEILKTFSWSSVSKVVEEAICLAHSYRMEGAKEEEYKPFWLEEGRHSEGVLKKHYIINKKDIHEQK